MFFIQSLNDFAISLDEFNSKDEIWSLKIKKENMYGLDLKLFSSSALRMIFFVAIICNNCFLLEIEPNGPWLLVDYDKNLENQV